jgi:hypothetical protein
MRHPEVFLVPVLLLVDYFLTVGGSKLATRKYTQHFKFEHYELNPLWQKSISQGKWLNLRHLLMVVIAGFICFVWADGWTEESAPSEAALGAVLMLYSTILAAHVGNFLTFWRMMRNPDEVTGEIKLAHKYLLAVSRYRSLMALFPLALAAWLAPSPFLYGGVAALVLFNGLQSIWSLNYRAQPSQEGGSTISPGQNDAQP